MISNTDEHLLNYSREERRFLYIPKGGVKKKHVKRDIRRGHMRLNLLCCAESRALESCGGKKHSKQPESMWI